MFVKFNFQLHFYCTSDVIQFRCIFSCLGQIKVRTCSFFFIIITDCLGCCFEELRCLSDISAIFWLGSRRYPISEIIFIAARHGLEPWRLAPQAKVLNHYTIAAPYHNSILKTSWFVTFYVRWNESSTKTERGASLAIWAKVDLDLWSCGLKSIGFLFSSWIADIKLGSD